MESAREGITSDGAVYGLPLYLEGYGFLYNKDYFEEAGISEVPLTLTELEQAVKKLEDAGIPPISLLLSRRTRMHSSAESTTEAEILQMMKNIRNGLDWSGS